MSARSSSGRDRSSWTKSSRARTYPARLRSTQAFTTSGSAVTVSRISTTAVSRGSSNAAPSTSRSRVMLMKARRPAVSDSMPSRKYRIGDDARRRLVWIRAGEGVLDAGAEEQLVPKHLLVFIEDRLAGDEDVHVRLTITVARRPPRSCKSPWMLRESGKIGRHPASFSACARLALAGGTDCPDPTVSRQLRVGARRTYNLQEQENSMSGRGGGVAWALLFRQSTPDAPVKKVHGRRPIQGEGGTACSAKSGARSDSRSP